MPALPLRAYDILTPIWGFILHQGGGACLSDTITGHIRSAIAHLSDTARCSERRAYSAFWGVIVSAREVELSGDCMARIA